MAVQTYQLHPVIVNGKASLSFLCTYGTKQQANENEKWEQNKSILL